MEDRNLNKISFKICQEGDLIGHYSFFTGHQQQFQAKCITSCQFYYINRLQLLEILKQQSEDYEKFKMISDLILEKGYCDTYGKIYDCLICNQTHQFNQCPQIFFFFNRLRVVKENNMDTQQKNRQEFQRGTFRKVGYLKYQEYLQQAYQECFEKQDLRIEILNLIDYMEQHKQHNSEDTYTQSYYSEDEEEEDEDDEDEEYYLNYGDDDYDLENDDQDLHTQATRNSQIQQKAQQQSLMNEKRSQFASKLQQQQQDNNNNLLQKSDLSPSASSSNSCPSEPNTNTKKNSLHSAHSQKNKQKNPKYSIEFQHSLQYNTSSHISINNINTSSQNVVSKKNIPKNNNNNIHQKTNFQDYLPPTSNNQQNKSQLHAQFSSSLGTPFHRKSVRFPSNNPLKIASQIVNNGSQGSQNNRKKQKELSLLNILQQQDQSSLARRREYKQKSTLDHNNQKNNKKKTYIINPTQDSNNSLMYPTPYMLRSNLSTNTLLKRQQEPNNSPSNKYDQQQQIYQQYQYYNNNNYAQRTNRKSGLVKLEQIIDQYYIKLDEDYRFLFSFETMKNFKYYYPVHNQKNQFIYALYQKKKLTQIAQKHQRNHTHKENHTILAKKRSLLKSQQQQKEKEKDTPQLSQTQNKEK